MLECSVATNALHITLRPQQEADYPFLQQLYCNVREPELAVVPWPPEAKTAFLLSQCDLQWRHYSTCYKDAEFLIVEHKGKPVGRIYLYRGEKDLRIVDISILSALRNRGIGSALLQSVLNVANLSGNTVSMHVEKFNPAQNLYRRLGFCEIGENGPYWLMKWPRQE
jgi:N-acetylglutamate synthase-like GNAT family acetyltransferase